MTRLRTVLAFVLLAGAGACARPAPERQERLRVCSDPDNLPFSNDRGEGFENRAAELLAEELDAYVEYAWRGAGRSFLRETLKAGACDVVMGLPVGSEMALTTRPWYRSAYAFVVPAGETPPRSFDDARLASMRIGVPLVGDDGANPPAAHALAARGIVDGVRGFPVYGPGARRAEILDAVAARELDLAVVWGPLAGGYAARHPGRISFALPETAKDVTGLALSFGISLAVRPGETERKERLEAALDARRAEIDALLEDAGVPRMEVPR